MADTSVLVTGASSGLGLATAGQLAAAGWHVVLGARDPERGRAAVREIHQQAPEASVEPLPLDLADLASVRAAAATLAADGRPPLRALVGNAGVQVVSGVRRTADGFELTFGTNHLGHFLLTQLLADQLTTGARVVMVGSGTHFGPRRAGGFPAPRWEDPAALADPARSARGATGKDGRIRYATSKLVTNYFVHELARRLGPRGVTVNVYDPGLMPQTRLHRDYPPRARRIYERLGAVLRLLPTVRAVPASAADLTWLVTAPDAADLHGSYVVGRTAQRSSRESYDRDRERRLWEASEQLVAAPAGAGEEQPVIRR